jgi:hypothetical protein
LNNLTGYRYVLFGDDVADSFATGDHRENMFLVRAHHFEEIRSLVCDHFLDSGWIIFFRPDSFRFYPITLSNFYKIGVRFLHGAVSFT